jgi:hypothetical protein
MKSWILRAVMLGSLLLLGQSDLFSQTDRSVTSSPSNPGGAGVNPNIPAAVAQRVLALAAPHFNHLPPGFVAMYYSCDCIRLDDLGSGTYRVTYGGVGIQIVIDATFIRNQSGDEMLRESGN